MEEIINRVANSKLVTVNPEDYYPQGRRVLFDIKDWLFEGLVLREKDFREQVKTHDWSVYKDCYVVLTCSTDAIIPAWAYMLITTQLTPYAKKVVVGSLDNLENILYAEALQNEDFSFCENLPVIIKGCTNKSIPENAYIFLTQKLQSVAKSIMYGEACSSVPLYKSR